MKSLVERLASAVSEGSPVDWVHEKSATPEHHDTIEQLAVVERIRDAHRTSALETTKAEASPKEVELLPSLFAWGPLKVVERLDSGSAGEVYRAVDTGLNAEVALKLLRSDRADSDALTDRFLAEGARLARVHHQNVLVVHGAARHDGRAGIWTELVRGESLEDRLVTHGPLGACEAAVIGLELCRALAAVHAAGIVHRDVKARNVMREERGRIVLMDLGAGAERFGAESGAFGEAVQGTPIYMAPEQLQGEPATVSADIYSLGVLLYHLLTGEYPVEASSFSELIERHRSGERVPLRDRRPDLSLEFVRVIERAIEPDPAARFQSAGEMEHELAASIGAMGRRREIQRRDQGFLVGALAATAALLAVFLVLHLLPQPVPQPAPGPSTTVAPRSPLEASVELLRFDGSNESPLRSGMRIAPGEQLSMLLQSNDSLHVYVFDEDASGEFNILYPVNGLVPANPLAGSHRHRLPGDLAHQMVYWTITSAGGKETIITVGSRTPLPDLEAQLRGVPRAEPGRPIRFGRLDPFALRSVRGIEGGAVGKAPPSEARRRVLDYLQGLEESGKKDGSIFVWRCELSNPPH